MNILPLSSSILSRFLFVLVCMALGCGCFGAPSAYVDKELPLPASRLPVFAFFE